MKNYVSRRSVLRASAALSASALFNPLARAGGFSGAPDAPSPIRLGIASYTFRKFNDTQLIEFMKQLKTPYLNLKDTHLPMTPLDQVKTKADEYRAAGFKLTAAGTIYFPKDEDDDIRMKFEYCKAAGIPIIVGAPTHQTIGRVEKFVKQYDIKLAIHNHGTEDKEWPSPLDVLKVVKNMDPRMGCCIDVGHTMRAGTDPVEAVHLVGPRLFDMHMKDLADGKVKESQVAVGEGVMPVRDIFKALIAIKYPGNVDLEYEIKENDPMPGVVESFAYMRGVLAGLGYKG
ncbi:sugar phosphate isomerase/epimerase family protein [Granulicella sibirica]|uniref:Xylose isomerase domain protein TIM barrel n=1 Tax=Granulicella sibirica TaxID=2479048 RepID=A0A4Q0T3E9_9BACT|nr:sugar phosphate isomerase/epimerase [Granulicella sibirica]RXH56071.1 Xylose isomerase domain protein TIM barrel [Granulicella sibirica]